MPRKWIYLLNAVVLDPSFVASAKATTPASGSFSGGDTIVVPVPTGSQAGDHLFVLTGVAAGSMTQPGGFTTLHSESSHLPTVIWHRILPASPPANYTWTCTANNHSRGGVAITIRDGAIGDSDLTVNTGFPAPCPDVQAGANANALFIGFYTWLDLGGVLDEDAAIHAGGHVMQTQHIHKGTATYSNGRGHAVSLETGLTASENVTDNDFTDPEQGSGPTTANTCSIIVDPD